MEASIRELKTALASGQTTSVELVAKSLHRVAKYDRRGVLLNSIPIINQQVFQDAAASDERRAAGLPLGLLEGVPCTIKDSYKIKGMTVASGSHAFQHLIANEDAFTVNQIRKAGGIVIGRTNMPPMAAGGMQRGVYGRAESPYNKEYLTAAFASGSSNGSATATAASIGAFGMGEETISSGRSPASNNALVAYTPSRGIISIRGNWPLFPTCDTVVPHTRTISDMFDLLNVLVADDVVKTGDFWRAQPFVPLPLPSEIRPTNYHDLAAPESLAGKRIGVPKMYVGKTDAEYCRKVAIRQTVLDLWEQARADLESLGAAVVEVDFPVVSNFEKSEEGAAANTSDEGPPAYQDALDMRQLMAYAWDDFLINNKDPSCNTLATVDPGTIFPQPLGSLKDRYSPSDPLVSYD